MRKESIMKEQLMKTYEELVKKRIILIVRDAFNKNKFDYFSKDNEGKPKYITII